MDDFIKWIESQGYTFGGTIGPYQDEETDEEFI
jgi:hypothetical protein